MEWHLISPELSIAVLAVAVIILDLFIEDKKKVATVAAVGLIVPAYFTIDLWNTLFFTIFFLLLCVILGLFLAILLDRGIKGEGVFRTIYLFPMALSFVVTGVVWQWIFAPGAASRPRGVNALFASVGLDNLQWGWYTDTGSLVPFTML